MNKLAKYIFIGAVTAITIFLAWYFSSVLTSIIIAAVLSLIGKPLIEFLTSIKIGNWRISHSIAAAFTLLLIVTACVMLTLFIVPLVGNIFTDMSNIDWEGVKSKLGIPLMNFNARLHYMFPTLDKSITVESLLMNKVREIVNLGTFADTFGSITSFIVSFFVTTFTVIFVTFFFLKDKNTFTNMILALVPTKYEENTKRAMASVNRLLVRYFSGICIEALLITVLNTAGLYFIGGLSFQLSVVLAFLSGILNVIPYIGPLAAGAFGTIMGLISLIGSLNETVMGIMIIKFIAIFVVTHLIDVFIFQPYIYSNSVKAHPLEIFIVILLAGHIGGIIGMLVAIPAYTVLRVFAKEFLSNFKVVQKLTNRME
ncbi:MAG: AI-2E family transporter [Bacteroidales bacterium]|nr:AI-2E family transporter [Bacteroidales bacterium]